MNLCHWVVLLDVSKEPNVYRVAQKMYTHFDMKNITL